MIEKDDYSVKKIFLYCLMTIVLMISPVSCVIQKESYNESSKYVCVSSSSDIAKSLSTESFASSVSPSSSELNSIENFSSQQSFSSKSTATSTWSGSVNLNLILGENKKVGVADENGNIILEPIYDYIHPSAGDDAILVYHNEKYGFFDMKGTQIIPFLYDSACHFSEGLAVVMIDNKYGYINKQNEIVIEAQYERADGFNHNGCAVVMTLYKQVWDNNPEVDDNYYKTAYVLAHFLVIDKEGKIVYDPKVIIKESTKDGKVGLGLGYPGEYFATIFSTKGKIPVLDLSGKETSI